MIKVGFDYRSDCPKDHDPDKFSKKLKEDHCELWSRELPNNNGKLSLNLVQNKMKSDIDGKQMIFGSDSITNCYMYWESTKNLREEPRIKALIDEYLAVDYTIGSSIIFPVTDDSGSSTWTINKARGCSRLICDRIDYTLECIRLFYLDNNNESPLKNCLNRYKTFFKLFGDFKGYVQYFFLDDLVSDDYQRVVSFTETIDFNNALPTSLNYAQYIRNTIVFIKNRNRRIKSFLNSSDY